ncbi:pantoate--beta-alanine ligase [Nesterenkonia sp. NBAIMH1]|uniref:pantoate--beta-alanine ligase n=1 Tax=Nesterenkonia sp. NBAIMH1 TaxID=2600320 RepID=UPI0011B3622A|nr:pantoate--beta-alanine ligase [Nesterenkonia sp. NBAIMH1]
MTQILRTIPELQDALAAAVEHAEASTPTVGFVPTMGALHSGHGELLRAARESADIAVASVFVNPLQFDDASDYLHYPRQLEADAVLLEEHGVDLVFAPSLDEMYPGEVEGSDAPDPQVRVSVGDMGRMWEGASRAGHFDGVATAVAKLLSIVAAPLGRRTVLQAWFGEKDAEQLAIIRRLAADLNLPAEIRAVPIVRDENGLALSSRNQRLTPEHYQSALSLSGALRALAEDARRGRPLNIPLQSAHVRSAGADLDYLVVVDPATLKELDLSEVAPLRHEALTLIAARVGPVRLIDTMRIGPTV